jgi:hypothetical protein
MGGKLLEGGGGGGGGGSLDSGGGGDLENDLLLDLLPLLFRLPSGVGERDELLYERRRRVEL